MSAAHSLSFKRVVVISRPIGQLLALAIYGSGVVSSSSLTMSWGKLLIALYLTLPAGLIICGINDITDRHSDRLNSRKGGIHGAVLQEVEVAPLKKLLVTIVVLGPVIFVVSGQIIAALLVSVLSLISYAYSVTPLRFKRIPGLDILSNVLGTLCIFGLGYYADQAWAGAQLPPLHLLFAISLFTAGVFTLGAVADFAADTQSGDRTIAISLGRSPAIVLSAACLLSCYFLVGRNDLVIGSYILLAAIGTFLALLIRYPGYIRNLLFGIVVGFPVAMLPHFLR